MRRRIASQIDAGELEPDTRLPTVRELARQMGVANNTAAKTYRELEAAGYIRTEGRRGTFVAARTALRDSSTGQHTSEDPLAHCMAIEMSLLHPGSLSAGESLTDLFEAGFTMVHHDGRLLDRQQALAILREQAQDPTSVEELRAEHLAPSVVLLGYVARRGSSAFRHSVLWVRGVTGWRCRHHQSTPILG